MVENQFNDLISSLKNLSKEQKELLISKLINQDVQNDESIKLNFRTPNCCRKCGSVNFLKHDKRNERQRYKCVDCKATFTEEISEFFKRMRKTHFPKFIKFLECMLNNLSLHRSAEICKITYKCSFKWRHKVMDLIEQKQEEIEELTGLIEIDETYLKDRQKGNFKNGIGREPRRQTYEPNRVYKRGLSSEKVCVSTAISRDGKISIKLLGTGRPSAQQLIENYKTIITNPKKSKIICDGERAYNGFSTELGCTLKSLKKQNGNNHKMRKIPVIQKEGNEIYHIQNVNNFHQQIKALLEDKFKGVNTNNLVKYINWVKWQRQHKSNFYVMLNQLINYLF